MGFHKGIDNFVYSAKLLTTHTQMDQGVLKTKEQTEGSVKPSHDNNIGLPQAQLKAGEFILACDNCEVQMGLGHLFIPSDAHSSWE